MSPSVPGRAAAVPGRSRPNRAIPLVAAVLLLGACAGPPVSNTPAPATGVFEQMAANGIATDSLTAGDGGCNDPGQAPFAIHALIRYPASSKSTADVYLFTYADHGAWQRQAGAFEACRETFVATGAHGRPVVELDISPYRAFGPAWSAGLRAALEQSLTEAAGNGG